MCRKLYFFVCFVLLLSISSYTSAQEADAEIPMAGSVPIIDGQMESIWLYTEEHKIANPIQSASSSADCSGSWRAYWDNQYLYVFIDVNDDAVVGDSTTLGDKYNDDSVEIFVDAGNTKATTYGNNDFQYRFGWDPENPTLGTLGADHGNSLEGIDRAFGRTSTGYSVEARVPWSILFPSGGPAMGDLMGFEAQINDDDDGGGRDSQLDWYSTTNDAWQNPSVFGTVVLVMGSAPNAAGPNPSNGEIDVPISTLLAWTPGIYANTHDVYFGISFADVNSASRTNPLDVLKSQGQDANSFDPPGALTFGTTYYWRVDEVNAPPDSTVFKGDVWSFTVEPIAYPISAANIIPTASGSEPGQGPEKTIDGSGLDENDLHSTIPANMWLSSAGDPGSAWIQYEFDKPYRLHEMLVWNYNGDSILSLYGIKEVTIEYSADSVTWTQANVSELAQATGVAGYAANTTVPFNGAEVKYVKVTANNNWIGGTGIFNKYGLSEVRFTYIPVSVRYPVPGNEETDVAIDTSLSWRPGREAAQHIVYLSTDQQAVIDGTAFIATVDQPVNGPLSLDLGTMYYWRIDEVNNLEAVQTWLGDVWSFTTQEYLVVDDFESYNDIPEGQEGSNLVYITWEDGYANPATNGSTMGYATGASMETDIVYGGKQSVSLTYNNTSASLSEVTVDPGNLPIGRNWSKGSPQALVLWIYGDPNNTGTEQLYVKLNNSKQVINGIDLTQATWQNAEISLADFGINLANVTQLVIGLERTGATGSEGILFMDDIWLYKSTL
jgi:hypothetical protein